MNRDKGHAYFPDGLMDEVHNALARIREFGRSGTAKVDRGDIVLAVD
jgi:hypothetical protein